ncbi:chemotaxis protein CheW [soil metagenome]
MTSETTVLSILLVRLAGAQIGFSASSIREVLRSVTIAPLLGTPRIIEGAVNFRGRIVPVVNVRARLSLPALANAPDQFLVILEVRERLIAVRVDDVEDLVDVDMSELETPKVVSPVVERLTGIAATAAGALVIYDADAFLTQAERDAIDAVET